MTAPAAELPAAPAPAAPTLVGAEPLPAVHARPWAVGVHLAFTAALGLAWSVPLAAAASAVTGAYPRGDAELFDPGAVMLAEAARRVASSFSVIGAAWVVVAVLALPLSFVVLGFVLAQLASRFAAGPRLALARAVRSVPALVVIGLVVLLVDAAVVALLMIAGGEAVRSTWPTPPARDLARLGLFGVVAVAVLAVGVVHDLARAAAVSGPSRAYGAMRAALRTVVRGSGARRVGVRLACVCRPRGDRACRVARRGAGYADPGRARGLRARPPDRPRGGGLAAPLVALACGAPRGAVAAPQSSLTPAYPALSILRLA